MMDALRDPKIKELAAKVSLREDAELNRMFEDGHMPARVKIKTKREIASNSSCSTQRVLPACRIRAKTLTRNSVR